MVARSGWPAGWTDFDCGDDPVDCCCAAGAASSRVQGGQPVARRGCCCCRRPRRRARGRSAANRPRAIGCARLALERRTRLRPVEDTRALLEAVYGSDAPLGGSAGHGQALSRAHNAWLQTSAGERAEAQWLTLKAVGLGGVFGQVAADPVAEHVGVRLSLATLMREVPQGLTLICLHMNGREIALSGEGGEPFDISAPPDAVLERLPIARRSPMRAEYAERVWCPRLGEHPLLRSVGWRCSPGRVARRTDTRCMGGRRACRSGAGEGAGQYRRRG